MRILYAAQKFDYGQVERGFSFEHYNFFDSLLRMGHEVLYFDLSLLRGPQRGAWNSRLLDVARTEKPDLFFSVMFEEELDKSVIRKISRTTDTPTVNWFCDDHWRFDHFSRHWADNFNWVVTTAQSALPKYKQIGYRNVIKSQWACNPHLYRKLAIPLRHDMTFVGQPHGTRRSAIEEIRAASMPIEVWGLGWGNGRLSQQQMIETFCSSKINLNLTNSSTAGVGRRQQGYVERILRETLHAMPMSSFIRGFGRRLVPRRTPGLASRNANTISLKEQIKGRNFEVPGCGGFILTGRAEELDRYFIDGNEIVIFGSTADLIDKARYYLSHERERIQIAEAGYHRTLTEHTYEHRFAEIFKTIGAGQSTPRESSSSAVVPGSVIEVTL